MSTLNVLILWGRRHNKPVITKIAVNFSFPD